MDTPTLIFALSFLSIILVIFSAIYNLLRFDAMPRDEIDQTKFDLERASKKIAPYIKAHQELALGSTSNQPDTDMINKAELIGIFKIWSRIYFRRPTED